MRDWKPVRRVILGIEFKELVFKPLYSGNDFRRACHVAEENHAAVWEDNRTRGWWIVSYEQPPYALAKPNMPRDPNWVLMGDAREKISA